MGRQSIYFTSWPCFSLVSSTTRRAPRGRDLCLFCSLLSTTEPGPYSAFRKSLLSGWCGQFKEIFTQLFQVCLTLRQCRGFLKLLRTQFFSFPWSFTSYQDACDDLLSLSFGISVTLCPFHEQEDRLLLFLKALAWTSGEFPDSQTEIFVQVLGWPWRRHPSHSSPCLSAELQGRNHQSCPEISWEARTTLAPGRRPSITDTDKAMSFHTREPLNYLSYLLSSPHGFGLCLDC